MPLHKAAAWGNVVILQRLIDVGAMVNVMDYKRQTARDCAISKGQIAAAELLHRAAGKVAEGPSSIESRPA